MSRRRMSIAVFIAFALALSVGLATAASPYASTSPDGLNRVAADTGFVDTGHLSRVQESSPIPGYAVPGVDDPTLAKGLAGFIGTLAVFAVGGGLAYVLRRRSSATPAPAGTASS